MRTFSAKLVIAFGSSLMIVSVVTGVFLEQPVVLFAPAFLLAAFFLVQFPQLLFYTLIFTVPWSVEANITRNLGTDLPDEPLMLLMAFSVLAMFLVRQKAAQPWPPLLWLLFASTAWTAVTVAASTDVTFSLKFLLAKSWYLLAFVGAPMMLNGNEKLVRRSALVLLCSMFTVTVFSLYKHANLGFTFATINEALAPFFRNHVNYSALLVCMVPVQLGFYSLQSSRNRRIIILVSIGIVLAAVYFSFARGAWLALVAGMLSYWLIRKRWLVKSFIAVIILVAGLACWLAQNNRYLNFAPKHDVTIFHKDFSEHLVATYKGEDLSTAERFYRWVAGIQMSGERWATGFGPTTFYQHYKSYTVPAFRTWVSDNREQSTVHNYFLLLLIEQGVVGLTFFLLLIGTMFWFAQKIYHRTNNRFWKITVATIAAILCMQCTINFLSDLIETDKVGSIFYLCLSFLLLADAKTKHKKRLMDIHQLNNQT